MNGVTVTIPPPLVERLRARQVTHKTLPQVVVDALWDWTKKPVLPEQRPGESHYDYLRRVMLELRGGVPPSPDEPFTDHLTRAQYASLSNEEREALWTKWHEEAWEEIEKRYKRGVDVHIQTQPARQKRGSQPSRRTRSTLGRKSPRR